jgi:hypothetical protein
MYCDVPHPVGQVSLTSANLSLLPVSNHNSPFEEADRDPWVHGVLLAVLLDKTESYRWSLMPKTLSQIAKESRASGIHPSRVPETGELLIRVQRHPIQES